MQFILIDPDGQPIGRPLEDNELENEIGAIPLHENEVLVHPDEPSKAYRIDYMSWAGFDEHNTLCTMEIHLKEL